MDWMLFVCWEAQIFANIAESEQAHMDAIKRLLDQYGLADPAGEIGVFENPELQDLYDWLMLAGTTSLKAGLLVGGMIEEVDIEDLQVAIADTTKADLLRVYGNLMNGSENHLRAFAGAFETLTGLPYEAQYLTQEEVDAILGAAGIDAMPMAAAMVLRSWAGVRWECAEPSHSRRLKNAVIQFEANGEHVAMFALGCDRNGDGLLLLSSDGEIGPAFGVYDRNFRIQEANLGTAYDDGFNHGGGDGNSGNDWDRIQLTGYSRRNFGHWLRKACGF